MVVVTATFVMELNLELLHSRLLIKDGREKLRGTLQREYTYAAINEVYEKTRH